LCIGNLKSPCVNRHLYYIIETNVWGSRSIFENENRQHIKDAFSRAAKDPFPTIDDMHDAVYFEEGASA
jgi:TPP-dependent pyruvate/acetoin dehydrogenase alpha subunit